MEMLRERRSEPLGPDQRKDEIDAERDRDGKADEGFNHRGSPQMRLRLRA
jgi:hypothetical protein